MKPEIETFAGGFDPPSECDLNNGQHTPADPDENGVITCTTCLEVLDRVQV